MCNISPRAGGGAEDYIGCLEARLRRLLSTLIVAAPRLYQALASLDVKAAPGLGGAATDGSSIYVDPVEACRWSDEVLASEMLHVAMHVLLGHARAAELGEPGVVAADAKVDIALRDEGLRPVYAKRRASAEEVARLIGVSVEDLRRMSIEEIVERLVKRGESRHGGGGRGGRRKSGARGANTHVDIDPGLSTRYSSAPLVSEGSPRPTPPEQLATGDSDGGGREADGGAGGGSPGSSPPYVTVRLESPAELGIILPEIVAWMPSPAPRYKRSWSRRSRRFPAYPGRLPVGYRRLWILLDVSGSMLEEGLVEGVAAAASAVEELGVDAVLVAWGPGEPRVYEGWRGDPIEVDAGGGTLLSPALKLLAREAAPGDIAVLISDFEVYDYHSLEDAARGVRDTGVETILVRVRSENVFEPLVESVVAKLVTSLEPLAYVEVQAGRRAEPGHRRYR